MNRPATVLVPSATVYLTVCQDRAVLSARRCCIQQQNSTLSLLRHQGLWCSGEQADIQSQVNARKTNKCLSSVLSTDIGGDGKKPYFCIENERAKHLQSVVREQKKYNKFMQ